MTTSPALLPCAYACDPKVPSEPAIGWSSLLSSLEATHDDQVPVLLLTNRRSAAATRTALASHADGDRVRIVEVGLPRVLRRLERPRLGNIARIEYLLWWLRALRRVRAVARVREIALAHHVTFATEVMPTPVAALSSRVYRVWGPVGATGLVEVFRIRPAIPGTRAELVTQHIRAVLSWFGLRAFARGFDAIVATAADLFANAPHRFAPRVFPDVVHADLGIDGASVDALRADDAAIVLLAIGHLTARKRFELAIAALGSPALAAATLHVYGAPPPGDPNLLAPTAERYSVTDHVVFHGQVPRAEVIEALLSADVLVHPAGREGSNGTTGEAMSAGIPVVRLAGTGTAALLKSAPDAPRVILQPDRGMTPGRFAEAIRSAADLPRARPGAWSPPPFSRLSAELWAEAKALRPAETVT